MNESPYRSTERPAEELPRRLTTALQAAYHSRAEVPLEVDAAILAASRSRLQEIIRSKRQGRRPAVVLDALRLAASGVSRLAQPARTTIMTFSAKWSRPTIHRPLATAAALLLLLTLRIGLDERTTPRHRTQKPTIVREDLDGNGRVDIADAYLLACALRTAAPGRGEWDVNADGIVGVDDVEAIAREAVRLSGGPNQ